MNQTEPNIYRLTGRQKNYIKRKDWIDRVLAAAGLLCLSPVFALLAIAIKLEDGIRAPIFFKQKRVGKDKQHFMLYKYRSMKLDTPHDVPTHLLENPQQYITGVGRFLRKSSLDELPQLINICKGELSICGPRPALWNQYDLIEERDQYGVNDIKPGLTGWAQINGRDELEISEKARLDGYYREHIGFRMDLRCFFGTFRSVMKSEGVVEGGTGTLRRKKNTVMVITNHSYMLYRFRRELLEELLKENEVIISTPFVGHEDDLKSMGARCIHTEINRRGINPGTDLALMRRYRKMLKKERPDLVITYSIKPNIYAGILCSMLKIPYFSNVQGLGTAFQKKGMDRFVTFLYKRAFRRVKKVFFENEENAKEFQRRNIISASRQVVLSGAGINLEQYQYRPYPQQEKTHFLYLGRIMREKGINELFEAVQRLHEERADFVLDLVGFYEDFYKAQVERLEERGIVIFHGFQTEPRPYYAGADCVVLPSYHEGMSNVLLEAAATGRPVITSDIPGCREAVEPGQTGLLCEAKNAESLYHAMKQFLSCSREEREQMGIKARKKMETEFDKDKVVAETMAALEEDLKDVLE